MNAPTFPEERCESCNATDRPLTFYKGVYLCPVDLASWHYDDALAEDLALIIEAWRKHRHITRQNAYATLNGLAHHDFPFLEGLMEGRKIVDLDDQESA